MRKKKIGIIWAAPRSKNLGVSALSWSTAQLVADIAKDAGWEPEFHFFCGSGGPQTVLELPNGPIPAKVFDFLDFSRSKTYLKAILKPRCGVIDLLRMDVVLDVGEGDSFSDIYGMWRFDHIWSSKAFLARFGRRQVLMPQTIGPFESPLARSRAKSAMAAMERLFSRDAQSQSIAEEMAGAGRCKEIVDLAFALPWTPHAGHGPGRHVGLNVSGLLWNGGYSGGNQFGLAADYPQLVRDVAARILRTPDTTLHLVPHVVDEGLPVEDDVPVSHALAAELGERAKVAPRFADPCQAKSYISGLDFFMGARMHACIASFSSGVPVLPMAYSRKFNGLFQDTLGYPPLIDLKKDSRETALAKLDEALAGSDALRGLIRERMEQVAKPRLALLKSSLAEVLNG